MTQCNGLSLMTHLVFNDMYRCKTIPKSVLPILNQILFRTINYHKPLEFVRVKRDLLEGDPYRCLAPVTSSEKSVIDTLGLLCALRILVKISVPPSRTTAKLYGFNLPGILGAFLNSWEYVMVDHTFKKTNRSIQHFWEHPYFSLDRETDRPIPSTAIGKRGQHLLHLLNDYLMPFRPMFDHLSWQSFEPLSDVDKFCEALISLGPSEQERNRLGRELKKGIRARRIRRQDMKWYTVEKPKMEQEIERLQ